MEFNWISVEDRLPECSKSVLVKLKNTNCTEAQDEVKNYSTEWVKTNSGDYVLNNITRSKNDNYEGAFYSASSKKFHAAYSFQIEDVFENVTHWADIPQVSKENDK